MESRDDIEIATDLDLSPPLYRAIGAAAHRQGTTIEQFCYDVCIPAFQKFDAQYPVENVGPGKVVSAALMDVGSDIRAELTLSPELAVKLEMQASMSNRTFESMCMRVCISALQNATGETNTPIARGAGASCNDLD